MTDMDKAYKFRIYPNREQIERLDRTLTLCRRLYNACLEQRIIGHQQKNEVSYRMQAGELPALKKEIPEYDSVHSQVLQDTQRRLDRAFDNFFKRVRKRKQGTKIKAGYPRFKSPNRFRSITYPQISPKGGFKILYNNRLRLSKIGTIRIFKHREIKGKIKICTIKRDGVGDWWAIFTVETPDVSQKEIKTAIGIDVGLEKLVTLSNGDVIEPPKFLRKSEDKLKQLQRRVSRKIKGSNNRKKAIRRLAKVHRKIERQRDDFLHKLSRMLANKADLIAFENLNIPNMVKNHCLAKSIIDASWGKLMKMTTRKVSETGGQVVFVNPRGTSQICSRCGVTTKISLSKRIHVCQCGFSIDRDFNASLNILGRVGTGSAEPVPTPVEMLSLPSSNGDGM